MKLAGFEARYAGYLKDFEEYLSSYTQAMNTTPALLGESMRYSLLNGGKRLRPVLMLACADVLQVPKEEVLPFALALETIHTYSLIHDDLPDMDNDDFRRGKPSNHKVFGAGNALLAGDGLLNEAYSICFSQCVKGEKYVRASQVLNDCAGIYGMIAGQSADLLYTDNDKEISEESLLYIHENKTGKLLLSAVVIPSILADDKDFITFERFGKAFGLLFQLTDDILDVTGNFETLGKSIGKDEKENKLTCVRLYGLEGAKVRADMCAKNCHTIVEGLEGDTAFLSELIDYILRRHK